ncbi:MAG: hypothetical protein V1844_19300 [Pseudomonadota bacterium]
MVGTAWSFIQAEISPGVSTLDTYGRDIKHCLYLKEISFQTEGVPFGSRGRIITDNLPHPNEFPIKQVICDDVKSVCHISFLPITMS